MCEGYIKYKKGYKYQLVEDYYTVLSYKIPYPLCGDYFEMDTEGHLLIKKGYAWDGATCAIDTDTIMRAALEHDLGYELLRGRRLPESFRKDIDNQLYLTCLVDGMARLRAAYVRAVVRSLAGSAALPRNKKKAIISP